MEWVWVRPLSTHLEFFPHNPVFFLTAFLTRGTMETKQHQQCFQYQTIYPSQCHILPPPLANITCICQNFGKYEIYFPNIQNTGYIFKRRREERGGGEDGEADGKTEERRKNEKYVRVISYCPVHIIHVVYTTALTQHNIRLASACVVTPFHI